MREIRFRIWSTEHKIMRPFGLFESEMFEDDGPVMQFTGLLDKFGVEIYEGDIVEYDFSRQQQVNTPADELVGKGSVIWSDNNAAFTIAYGNDGWQHSLNSFDGQEFEVIGNVHMDKELLK